MVWLRSRLAESEFPHGLPYGLWISPSGEHHRLSEPGDHAKFAETHASKYGIEADDHQGDSENRWRVPMLQKGWVRVARRGRDMAVQAHYFTPEAAKKVRTVISAHTLTGGHTTIDRFNARRTEHMPSVETVYIAPHHSAFEVGAKLRKVFGGSGNLGEARRVSFGEARRIALGTLRRAERERRDVVARD